MQGMWSVPHKHEPASQQPTWAARGMNARSTSPEFLPPPSASAAVGDGAAATSLPNPLHARKRCGICGRKLVVSRFDTTFRMPDQSERDYFALPAAMCEECCQLFMDPRLIELLDLRDGRCVFAIENDLVVQEQAWSAE